MKEKSVCKIDELENKRWYLNGKLHREGDLPAVELSNGDKEWCINGKHHRDNNQPAVIRSSGDKFWCINDKLHRTDGPAIIYTNEYGDSSKYWWYLNDEELDCKTQEEFEYYLKYKAFL